MINLDANITFKLTQQEKEAIKAAAAAQYKTPSQYIRDVVREAVKKELNKNNN